MKVLIPVLHYPPVIGGLEIWTQNIAQGTAKKKAEVFVVTGKVKNEPEKQILNEVNITRTSLLYLNNLSHSSLIYIISALPFIFLKSLNLVKKEKINILHCQSFLSGFIGYLLFKLTGVPYIVTVQRLEQSRSFLKRLVYNNAKACIAASNKIKEYFESINCKNITIIPNGVDLKRFQNLDRKTSRENLGLKNEFVIVTVARLEKVKGIEYLIKAVKSLNIDYKLLIIGDGSEKDNLKNLVNNLNLQGRIRFLGQMPNEKIPEILSSGNCFVLPSISEGFGIVILEAMATLIPVIGTKVGGILDIIKDKENGILVKPKDSKELAEAIFKVYSQKEFTRNLIQNAKNSLEKYNWESIVQRVYKIYSQSLL